MVTWVGPELPWKLELERRHGVRVLGLRSLLSSGAKISQLEGRESVSENDKRKRTRRAHLSPYANRAPQAEDVGRRVILWSMLHC